MTQGYSNGDLAFSSELMDYVDDIANNYISPLTN